MTKNERTIRQMVNERPRTVDELVAETGMTRLDVMLFLVENLDAYVHTYGSPAFGYEDRWSVD